MPASALSVQDGRHATRDRGRPATWFWFLFWLSVLPVRTLLRQVHRTTFVDFHSLLAVLPGCLRPAIHVFARPRADSHARLPKMEMVEPPPSFGNARHSWASSKMLQNVENPLERYGPTRPRTHAALAPATDGRPASTKAPAWTRPAPAPRSKSGRWRRSSRWPGPSTDAWPRRRPRVS